MPLIYLFFLLQTHQRMAVFLFFLFLRWFPHWEVSLGFKHSTKRQPILLRTAQRKKWVGGVGHKEIFSSFTQPFVMISFLLSVVSHHCSTLSFILRSLLNYSLQGCIIIGCKIFSITWDRKSGHGLHHLSGCGNDFTTTSILLKSLFSSSPSEGPKT